MPFLLRKLDRRAAFHPVPWIEDGDVQADALYDLRTHGNELSVWMVPEDHSNLERVVAALAAARNSLDKLDYALIDLEVVRVLGIRVVKKKGNSRDEQANELWHQDLTGLSGAKIVELAFRMRTEASFVRVPKGDVGSAIVKSIRDGFIDPDRIEASLKKALPPERDPEPAALPQV